MQAPGDADLLIVRKAVESATSTMCLLVMILIYLACYAIMQAWTPTTYFSGQSQKKNTKTPRVWNMHQGCQGATIIIGPEVCTHAHSISACSSWM